MNPASGTILALLLLAVCLAPRRWALLAMVASLFVLTQGHSIDLAGLNVYSLRVLEAVALGRVLLRGELVWSRLGRIDWMLLLVYGYMAVVWILRSFITSTIAPQHFAMAIDPTLCYLGFRGLMRDPGDLRWLLRALVVLLVPYTALVFLERLTGHSSFALVGHASSLNFRNGVPRCEGSFRNPILLGAVAASFVPLYVGLALDRARRAIGLLGTLLCLALILWANSGGAVSAAATGLAAWSLWFMRTQMRLVRRSMLAVLVLLLLFMKAPIWYLPFKVSQITGGGGYHRGWLMDVAFQDVRKWWLFGMDLSETASWFPYTMTFGKDVSGADITNQFIVYGLRSGLLAILLFVALLALALNSIGTAIAVLRARHGSLGRADDLLLWGLGVTVVVHIANWLGVSYFDQSWAVWLFHMAALSASIQVLEALRRRPAEALSRDSIHVLGSAGCGRGGAQPRSPTARFNHS